MEAGGKSGLHQSHHFAGICMAARFKFGVDGLSIDNNIKNAAGALFQLRLYTKLLLDFSRETRSAGQVVSFTAIFD